MLGKPKGQFTCLCKCEHSYCYSCLNSYAISKIEDLSVVVCPDQKCRELMPLSSKVYKFLPDKIKIRYLQNRNTFKPNFEESRCQRCFESKHQGECKFSLQPKLIDNSFAFRKCFKCSEEIYITEGKKRVVCKNCTHAMCYLCGKQWKIGDTRHVCQLREEVVTL